MKLREIIKDEWLLRLLSSYFYIEVEEDGGIYKKERGIIQGAAISP